jgi:hypothetical protein
MSDFSSTKDWYTRILSNSSWDRYSVAIEHPYVYSEATEITIAYIQEGFAYIGKSNVAAINILAGINKIGAAYDISVAYDARWYLGADKEYHIYTLGTMYIAYVDTANNLYVRNGIDGVNRLLASGVDKCFIVRGWKHMTEINQDQGIVVFYIKNGTLFSRRYIQTGAQTYEWEIEKSYSLAKAVVDLQAYRTADFRIAICVKNSDGSNSMAITDRVFPGQSIPSETVKVQALYDIVIQPKPVVKVFNYSYETIKLNADISNARLYTHIITSSSTVSHNLNGDTIFLSISNYITESMYAEFMNSVSVTDDNGNAYSIISLSYDGMWLKLNMSDFNNAVGNINISYTTGITDDLGWSVPAFTSTFTPVGLVPTPPDPPIVISAMNVNTEVE